MAIAFALAVVLLAWLGSFVLLGKGESLALNVSFTRRMFEAALLASCEWIVRIGLVALLLRNKSWRAAADALNAALASYSLTLGREFSCALIVFGWGQLCVFLTLFSQSPTGSLVGLIAVPAALSLWCSSAERARHRSLVEEMPSVFRTLATAMGSGETLLQAVEYVGIHEKGYAAKAFARAALRLRCGASAEQAMEVLASELDAPGVGLLTTALTIAQRTGSPLRELFQSSAQLVERQGELERALMIKTAQVRLSVRVVCLLPAIIVCTLSVISVDFQRGLATPVGISCVLIAALLDMAALAIIRSLIKGVL